MHTARCCPVRTGDAVHGVASRGLPAWRGLGVTSSHGGCITQHALRTMRNMRNPFRYGGIVTGEAFCNRDRELHDLVRAMENGDKLFVHSERRMGKTSLVKTALEAMDPRRYHKAYIDLWPTEGELSFAKATAKALAEAVSTSTDRLLETAKRFFGRLSPSITLDHQGKAEVTFQLNTLDHPGPELDQVLATPARLTGRGGKRLVIVFDEFQQLLEYSSALVERKLRSAVQTHEDVAYIFLGSRKHLIRRMFLDEARPLYRAGGHYPLGPIDEQHWVPFIRERFEEGEKHIAEAHIRSICKLTEGHPFYTQHLCHALWELCDRGAEVSGELIDEAVELVLERESYAYATLWESLSRNQRRFLVGLAREEAPVEPFSASFVKTYGLGTASSAQRAAEALLERDVVDRDDGSFVIGDRFLRIWLQRVT